MCSWIPSQPHQCADKLEIFRALVDTQHLTLHIAAQLLKLLLFPSGS